MNDDVHLMQALSDGGFHSGQQLAGVLGVSRTAIWKRIQRVSRDYGLKIDAVRGRGYRLATPLEMLDVERIRGALGEGASGRLKRLELQLVCRSTNVDAAQHPPTRPGAAHVWLAEHQTAGRGRRGRPWVSSFGENLYLSLGWRFDLPLTELSGLSLAAGTVLAESLTAQGVEGHHLKWPNDVLAGGRKLCGILVEAAGEANGPSNVVIGIGVNLRLDTRAAEAIDQPWTDLHGIANGPVSRNALASDLIERLIHACDLYAEHRLPPFLERWRAFDAYLGKRINISYGTKQIVGIYRGIAASGAVIVETDAGLSEYHAGEVSLRTTDP